MSLYLMKLVVILLCFLVCTAHKTPHEETCSPVPSNPLICDTVIRDPEQGVASLQWTIDTEKGLLDAKIQIETSSDAYFGWAVSPNGRMIGGDTILCSEGKVARYLMPSYSASKALKRYEKQDLSGTSCSYDASTGMSTMTFRRPLKATAPGHVALTADVPQAHIWAFGSGQELVHHRAKGSVLLTLSQGAGVIDTTSTTATAGAADTAGGSEQGQGQQSNEEGEESDDDWGESLWYWGHVHGVMMILSWGMLLPAGALAARLLRPSAANNSNSSSISVAAAKAQACWFPVHRALQGAGFAVAAVGAVVAMLGAYSDDISTLDSGRFWHSVFGSLITLLLVCQVALAVCRPKAPAAPLFATAARKYWERLHRAVGWGVLAVGAVQLAFGLGLEHSAATASGPVLVLLLCAGALWLSARRQRSKQRYWGMGGGNADVADDVAYDEDDEEGVEVVVLDDSANGSASLGSSSSSHPSSGQKAVANGISGSSSKVSDSGTEMVFLRRDLL